MRQITEAQFQSSAVREMVDGNKGFIVWKGKRYPAVSLPMQGGPASVALVASLNVANPDLHKVTLSPADFPSGMPSEEDQLTISEEGSTLYQVATVNRQSVELGTHSVTMVIFRVPPPNSATAPGGVRPSFRPPDVPQT